MRLLALFCFCLQKSLINRRSVCTLDVGFFGQSDMKGDKEDTDVGSADLTQRLSAVDSGC